MTYLVVELTRSVTLAFCGHPVQIKMRSCSSVRDTYEVRTDRTKFHFVNVFIKPGLFSSLTGIPLGRIQSLIQWVTGIKPTTKPHLQPKLEKLSKSDIFVLRRLSRDVGPRCMAEGCQRFGDVFCFHHQGVDPTLYSTVFISRMLEHLGSHHEQIGGSMVSEGRFCFHAFGMNLASGTLKMFRHEIYFHRGLQKKNNGAINFIFFRHEREVESRKF